MEKIGGSPLWENIIKKVTKIKPLTVTSEVPDVSISESFCRRKKGITSGGLSANHIREYLTEDAVVDDEIDVRRIGNKTVVEMSAAKSGRGRAPLARLESDFDLLTSPKRKTKSKTRYKDDRSKSDKVNDRIVTIKDDKIDITNDDLRKDVRDDKIYGLDERIIDIVKCNDRPVKVDDIVDNVVDKVNSNFEINKIINRVSSVDKSDSAIDICANNDAIDKIATNDEKQTLNATSQSSCHELQKYNDTAVKVGDKVTKLIDKTQIFNDRDVKCEKIDKIIDVIIDKMESNLTIDNDHVVRTNNDSQRVLKDNDHSQKVTCSLNDNDHSQKVNHYSQKDNDQSQKVKHSQKDNDHSQKVNHSQKDNDHSQKVNHYSQKDNDHSQKVNHYSQKDNVNAQPIKNHIERPNDKIVNSSNGNISDRLRLKLEFLGASEDIFSISKHPICFFKPKEIITSPISNCDDKKTSSRVTSWNTLGMREAKVHATTSGNNSDSVGLVIFGNEVRKDSFWPTRNAIVHQRDTARRLLLCRDEHRYSVNPLTKSVGTLTRFKTDTKPHADDDTNVKQGVGANNIFVGDVATLTEWFLSDLYSPFEAVRPILVKQARDILLCHFAGDYIRFRTKFLEPAAIFLREFRRQRERYHVHEHLDPQTSFAKEVASVSIRGGEYEAGRDWRASIRVNAASGQQRQRVRSEKCQRNSPFERESEVVFEGEDNREWFGWPLCYDGRLIVHLGELDSGLVIPKSGDFYFYLRATELEEGERRPDSSADTPTRRETRVEHEASAVGGRDRGAGNKNRSGVQLRVKCRLDSGASNDKPIGDYTQFLNIMDWSAEDKDDADWASSDLEENLASPADSFGEDGDERVSATLRHLLVAVERGIERLEWDKMKITAPVRPQSLGQTLVTSRERVIDTRDCSVQTSPAEELPGQTGNDADSALLSADVVDNETLTRTTNVAEDVKVNADVTEECLEQLSTVTEGCTMVQSSVTSESNEVDDVKEEEQRDDGYHDIGVSCQPSTISQVDQDLLHAEIAVLPGCRSKCGRSVLYLFAEKLESASTDQNITAFAASELPLKLAELLLYFGMIPKTEISKKGLVVLVDLSQSSVESCAILDEALSVFQTNGGVSVHSVLLWTGPQIDPVIEEFPTTPFPKSAVQWELLKSEDELCRLIPRDQLLADFGGTYSYNHQEWIAFRKFLEPFVNGCRLSGRHLVSVMRELTRGSGNLSMANATSTRQLIERQKRHIHSTYQDEQLRHLDEEGETILRELRHYCAGAPNNQDYKDALECGGALYGELRRAMNKLRKLADRRMKKLEECLHIKTLVEESSQVLSWLCRRGEESLAKHQMVAESLPAIKEQEEQFEKFYFLAMRQIEKGNDLLEEAALVSPATTPIKKTQSRKSPKDVVATKNSARDPENDVEDLTSSLKERLNSFSERLEETRERLEDTAKCYHLLDEVYEWALNTMNFVSEMKLDRVSSSGAEYDDVVAWTRSLDSYLDEHPPIADEVFREMILLAKASSPVNSPRLLQQCQTAQTRCVETVELVRARRASLLDAARALSSSESVRLRRDSSSSDGHHPKDWDPTPNPNKTTRSRSHPQNFWPRGSSTPSTSTCSSTSGTRHSACSEDAFDSPSNFYRHQNYTRFKYRDRGSCNEAALISDGCSSSRRRSMSAIAGPPSGFSSPFASYTSFPSNPYPAGGPLSTPRDCALQMDQYLRDKEEQLQSRGLITEDLTTRGPVARIERDDSRWSHNNATQANSPEDAVNASITSCIPMVSRSSAGSRLATKGSPPPSTSTSSLHPVTQKPVKKHMRICPTWQLREEALHKAAQQVRKQNERLGTQHKLDDETEAGDDEASNPDSSSQTAACANHESVPALEIVSRSSSIDSASDSPIPVNSHLSRAESSEETLSRNDPDTPDAKNVKKQSTLMLIMGELIQTERDYVKSLEYIIENYCPELLREDIPQALRGQRNVIFGNIEKIYEFHSQYFLQELELCEKSPFRVGQYFLQYERQFYLYALYNKNKPKSDNLMSEYGTAFFREKQLLLKDKMDLASYLLKPVQRMGKYALLLKQLLKECPEVEKESEYQDLKAAEEMVRFQLRHGNDLLAMDALRDCDVNVKEQGRLLRQDEFLVWQGRYRKSLRRVFLFEDLILFSKARRDPDQRGLQEIYQYKQSIKTTDIGMTEQIGDSPTKFEIWFRKRKLHDTYILQAASPEVKLAWAHEISRLLWKQALKNREIRLAEMSSMGIGNKPCLDIKPSEDQISDRSIRKESVPKTTRFRNSVSGSSTFDQLRTNKRPHSIISVSSSSSSGSSCGNNAHPAGVTPFVFFGAALNLGFEPGDGPRSHHRSETQQSQCSTESGFCTDTSLMGDQILSESESNSRFGLIGRCRRKAERSDSILSNDSITTQPSSTFEEFENNRPELPECPRIQEDLAPTTTPESSVTTSM